MKKIYATAAVFTLLSTASIAGPLDGIQLEIDLNGALHLYTSPLDGNDYAVLGDNFAVMLGSNIIAIRGAQGGSNANGNSVVGNWQSWGCSTGTRIDLPSGDGSPCE